MNDDKNNEKQPTTTTEFVGFIPSSTFQGSKPGYYFGTTTERGTGYYVDRVAAAAANAGGSDGASAAVSSSLNTKKNKKQRGVVQFAEEKNEMRLLREAEQQAAERGGASSSSVVELTPKGIQQATNALSKIYQKNSLLRAKHFDDPRQYMESEIQLYDQLSALQSVSAADGEISTLYKTIIGDSNGNDSSSSSGNGLVPVLIQLLGHENTDISACVVALLFQLIDPSIVEENVDDDPDCLPMMSKLVSVVLKEAWETIVMNLYQFQQQQQQGGSQNNNDNNGQSSLDDLLIEDPNLKGVDNTLSLMENILELDTLMAPYGGVLGGGKSVDDDDDDDDHNDGGDGGGSSGNRIGNENGGLSAAAYMIQESSILSWLFEQVETPPPSPATTASSTPSKSSPSSDMIVATSKEEEFKGRCMEMIAFISQNSDVFDVVPDWNSIPRVVVNNGNSSNGETTKPPPSKKQKTDPPSGKASSSSTGDNVIEGIDILLQSIGRYRKKQPSNDQQIEYLENSCIALSSCITFSTDVNLKHFIELEGVPLVMYCEKNNVHSGCSALRLLDFSMEGDTAKRAADEVVTSGLLKYLFPLFLGTRIPKPASPLKSVKSKRSWLNDIKTRTIRTLYGLSFHLDATSPEDGKERFVAKFIEDNQKNCDRLVELLLEYDTKARKAEYKFFRSDIDESIGEEQVALAAFDEKLKAGGDMCHRLAAIAACICACSKRCHERILSQLKLQQAGVSLIKESLTEFSSSLRPGRQQDHINGLIDQI